MVFIHLLHGYLGILRFMKSSAVLPEQDGRRIFDHIIFFKITGVIIVVAITTITIGGNNAASNRPMA